MNLSRSYKARLEDTRKLKQLESINPSWVLAADPAQFTAPYHKKIGIEYEAPTVGPGFLKFLYRDFIVEELPLQGTDPINISPDQRIIPNNQTEIKKPKIGATLIKQGMPTFEAAERLAEALNLNLQDIGYAGLKDSRAITAQEISINNMQPEALSNLAIPNLFLKDIHPRLGVLNTGNLRGNRFTILIRCQGISEQALSQHMQSYLKEGFLNFYSLQRFGSRLTAQDIGRCIFQKKYEEAVRLFLIGESPHESFTMQNFRQEAAKFWGDWAKMAEIFMVLPYFFYQELKILEALQKYPKYFDFALENVQDVTKIIYHSYTSYWYNRLLSYYKRQGQLPEVLPVIRNEPGVLELYKKVMPEDELAALNFGQSSLPFLNSNKPVEVKTRLEVVLHKVKPVEQGFIFHFDLQKGAYATAFLSQIFSLYQGRPVPEWVPQEPVDTRLALGYPSVELTETKLKENVSEDTADWSEEL